MKIETKQLANITAFKLPETQEALAFHTKNLEIAKISEELFQLLSSDSVLKNSSGSMGNSALDELHHWSDKVVESSGSSSLHKIKSLNINVTQICNLHCTYCAAGGDGSYGDPLKQISIEKTLPQIGFFMDRLQRGNRFHISFLGGEPLLYPEGIELIAEYAKDKAAQKDLDLSMKVTTNGTILNQQIVNLLKKYKLTLAVSMDGPPEVNDKVRPQKNHQSASKEILKNLDKIFEIKKEIGVVGVHAVFSKQNMAVVDAYQFFSKYPFDFMDFMFSVSDNDSHSNQLFVDQMAQVAQIAWSKGQEEELRKIYIFDHYFDLLDDQRRLENHCGLGKTLAVIDGRNRIYNCPWTVGTKQNQLGQETILDSHKLDSYNENLIQRNDCDQCWARYLCGGGCSFIHQTTSDKANLQKNELFCDRTRSIIALAIYYFSLSRELMT